MASWPLPDTTVLVDFPIFFFVALPLDRNRVLLQLFPLSFARHIIILPRSCSTVCTGQRRKMSNAHARVLNVETVQELPSWRRDRGQRDSREAERERRRAHRALDVHRPLPAFRPDDTEEEKKPPACA